MKKFLIDLEYTIDFGVYTETKIEFYMEECIDVDKLKQQLHLEHKSHNIKRCDVYELSELNSII